MMMSFPFAWSHPIGDIENANQRFKSLMESSKAALKDNHQARMARYLDSASSIVFESLYFLQRRLCWSCMFGLICFCLCRFSNVVQSRKQVRSLFYMETFESPLP
jgi:hypothetical protein